MGSKFREWYGKLCQVRSFVPTGTPIAVLTATATKLTCSTILKHMNINSAVHLQLSPNRSNIRYSVCKASRNCNQSFKWLLDDLREQRQNLPRVLVFCRSILTCSNLYKYFLAELREQSYLSTATEPDISHRLFAMFHSRVDEEDKASIIDSMKKSDGACRVVFCTIAFGMGMDISNIRTVVHYGPSHGLDDYLQETGRAGRDGQPSNAVLYVFPGSTLGQVSPEMKAYTNNDSSCDVSSSISFAIFFRQP